MAITHSFTSAIPDGPDPTIVRPSNWNADHVIALSASDIPPLDYISGTGVVGQVAEFVTDTKTLQAAKLIAPVTNILTLTNAAASTLALAITSAKTLTLTATDNFNLTIPATGTAAMLGTANVFTTQQMIDGTSNQIQLRVQGHSTQTTNLMTWETSAAGVLASISGAGEFSVTNARTAAGAAFTLAATGNNAAGIATAVRAMVGTAYNVGTGALTSLEGMNFTVGSISANNGNVTNARVLRAATFSNNTGVFTNVFGLYVDNLNTYGTPTNTYGVAIMANTTVNGTTKIGIYVENLSGSTNNYAIYTNAGLNRLGDQLSIVGSADRIQSRILAHSTQTALLATYETSAGAVVNSMSLTAGAVFNEQGTDVIDFRVESDTLDAIFVDSSTDTVALKGGQIRSYVAKTANYTLTLKDYVCDVTANTINITLPTAVGCTGQIYHVNNSGTGVVTILTTSSQTINGATSQLVYQYESIALMSNNANWIIL